MNSYTWTSVELDPDAALWTWGECDFATAAPHRIHDRILGFADDLAEAGQKLKWNFGHPPLWRQPAAHRDRPVKSIRLACRRASPRFRESPGINPLQDAPGDDTRLGLGSTPWAGITKRHPPR